MPAFMAGFSPEEKIPAIGQLSTLDDRNRALLWTGTQNRIASELGSGCLGITARCFARQRQGDTSACELTVELEDNTPSKSVPR
jgi:hypothetical protein